MFRKKGPKELQLAKEGEIKLGMTQALSQALKSVQREHIDDRVVYSTDTANTVCNCLEATFLHGLKSSSAKKIASYMGFGGQQSTAQVAVNFWAVASKFTHSEVIAQLKHLGQITTEIGLCRAWVRVGLNDNLMESYVDAICSDMKTLEYFYHSTAYLRDPEHPGILKSLLGGLMAFEFKLSYNASVLNEWAYPPLTLCGLLNPIESPLPVVKPAAAKRTSKSSDSGRSQHDSSAVVRQVRSGSHGSSDGEKSKSKYLSHDSRNPMEKPQFGKPSTRSYFVSTSEFTREDVEQLKKLAQRSSPTAQSIDSSSSRISCPDPPNLNLSPSEYVKKRDRSLPRLSSKSTLSDTGTDSSIAKDTHTGKPADHVTVFGEISDLNNEPKPVEQDMDANGNLDNVMGAERECEKLEYDSQVSGYFHVSSREANDSIGETHSEADDDIDIIKGIGNDIDIPKENTEDELEESWEEFYSKGPVAAVKEEQRKRLESFNQDMKLQSILDDFAEADEHMGTASLQLSTTTLTNSEAVMDCDIEVDDTCISTEVIKKMDDSTDDQHGCVKKIEGSKQDEVKQDVESQIRKLNYESNQILDRYTASGSGSSTTEKCLGNAPSALTHSNLELFNKEFNKAPGHIEEMVGVDSDDVYNPDDVKHKQSRESSPRKKRDGKKGRKDRLRPQLSPPTLQPLEPELSEAVVDSVDTIQQLKETLATKRMSLPVTRQEKSGFPSVISMPNMSEITEAPLPNSASESNFDAHIRRLYDGMPIDMEEDDELKQMYQEADRRQSLGNSLTSGRGWSSSIGSEMDDTVEPLSPPKETSSVSVPTRPKAESFGSLLQNYTPASSISAPSIDDVLHNLPRTSTILSPPKSPEEQQAADDQMDGFEIVTESHLPDLATLSKLTHLSAIANEKGLDAQNYQCKGCSRPLGLIFGKPRVCAYDGSYYCFECHENDEYYIPAVIIHNWDFRKQKVCKKNYELLVEIEEQPHIELEAANPRLYDHVPEMAEIRKLRTQLLFLKTYLFTCKQSVVEDFQRLVWPRDYLYENIELYSLADLLQVPTGGLATSLRKVIRYATKHVLGCRLCSQKGFICELCNNPKVIYAFEMDTTYRCPGCRSVFHSTCKTDNRPCPKCHRRSLRETHNGIEPSISDYDVTIQS